MREEGDAASPRRDGYVAALNEVFDTEDAPPRKMDAERALWSAVLKLSVNDALKRECSESCFFAWCWVFDPSPAPGSFLWVCDMLGIDCPERIQQTILYATEADRSRLRRRSFWW
jgi:hypothetical protein